MTKEEARSAKGHYATLSAELIQILRNGGAFSRSEKIDPQDLFEVLEVESSTKSYAPERVWLTLDLPTRNWDVPANLATLVLARKALKDLDFDA